MTQKNLMSQTVKPANSITTQDLSAELVELSEEDLQQVVGGGWPKIGIEIKIVIKF